MVERLVRVAYLDGTGSEIVSASLDRAGLGTPWVLLAPASAPRSGADRRNGQALVTLASYGDCGPAPELHTVTLTFAPPTGTVRIAMTPARVRGRCDAPGQHLILATFYPLAPTTTPPSATTRPQRLSFSLDAPLTAYAGETLRYLLRVLNVSGETYAWPEGCPIYTEWLGGHEVEPSPVPGHAPKPPERIYAGFAKEQHTLDCTAAGPIAAGAEVTFEMHLDVPRDALGPDTLRWEIVGSPRLPGKGASLELLAPRR